MSWEVKIASKHQQTSKEPKLNRTGLVWPLFSHNFQLSDDFRLGLFCLSEAQNWFKLRETTLKQSPNTRCTQEKVKRPMFSPFFFSDKIELCIFTKWPFLSVGLLCPNPLVSDTKLLKHGQKPSQSTQTLLLTNFWIIFNEFLKLKPLRGGQRTNN